MDKYQRADAHAAREKRLEEILDRGADQVLDLLEAVLEGRKRVVVLAQSRIDGRGTMAYSLEVEDIPPAPAERNFDLARTSTTDEEIGEDAAAWVSFRDRVATSAIAEGFEGVGMAADDPMPQPAGADYRIGRPAPCDVCGKPGKFLSVVAGVTADHVRDPDKDLAITLAFCDEHAAGRDVLDDGSPL